MDCPTWAEVEGSLRPIVEGLTHPHGVFPNADEDAVRRLNLSVGVIVPNDVCDPLTGELDLSLFQAKYAGQEKWDRVDYKLPLADGV